MRRQRSGKVRVTGLFLYDVWCDVLYRAPVGFSVGAMRFLTVKRKASGKKTTAAPVKDGCIAAVFDFV